MVSATTDLCDGNEGKLAAGEVRVLAPVFLKDVGGARSFWGKVVTVQVFEDNVKVRELLEKEDDGKQKVLVVDGGGSLRCALLGGNLAALAEKNGWSGIIVNGCVRDVGEINGCNVGVRALAAHPRKSNKRGHGQVNVPVSFAGVRICPGEWCYADADGIIVSATPLH
ncbi:hypothetical protein CBR_g4825 [Chara braunii]|uniref:4-hydroxy-4-methyl-2-oxoglutarate aldolase n=1 Tax=Chara braunii TaxID=69332 RepID=A0A388KJ15_CHABU|nr:hypothetical protein CBR_g4825 [Chara braunii]|eukprot:GBG69998.1 hypothetical protein CBR_g4825 [Chara braunii]